MKKLVGKRIVKTGLAVTISLALTSLIGFDTTFAGVVSLIGLKETTKRTFHYSFTLILGSLISLVTGIGVFLLFGNNPLSFGIGTIIVISILTSLKLYEGLILSVIVMYHILENSPEKIGDFLSFSFSEFTVILIGITISILVNSAFPQKYNRYLAIKIEELYSDLANQLSLISEKVSNPNMENIDISSLRSIRTEIKTLLSKAEISKENTLKNEQEQYEAYVQKLKYLKRLVNLLEDMSNEANRLSKSYEHSYTISKAFSILTRIQSFPEQTTISSFKRLLQSIHDLHDYFKESPLPESRTEFENRSSLYHLYLSIQDYADQLFLLHDKL